MFEVGDRVEVVGADKYLNLYGKEGILSKSNRTSEWKWVMTTDEGYHNVFRDSDLKLIKKGKDMKEQKIKVKDKVEIIGTDQYGENRSLIGKIVVVHNKWSPNRVAVHDLDGVYLGAYCETNVKLISEGDSKMKPEKKIKINTVGLKLKMGVETPDGIKGNIYSMSPQIVVVEDENGKHHSCQSNNVKILYSVPEEAVNPKTRVMTKAEARKMITQAKKVLAKK